MSFQLALKADQEEYIRTLPSLPHVVPRAQRVIRLVSWSRCWRTNSSIPWETPLGLTQAMVARILELLRAGVQLLYTPNRQVSLQADDRVDILSANVKYVLASHGQIITD